MSIIETKQIQIDPVAIHVPVVKINSLYNKIINIYSESGITNENIALEEILVPDSSYTFLREVIKEGDPEILDELVAAGNFMEANYGIDIKQFKDLGNFWKLGEHTFYPYQKGIKQIAVQLGCNCCGVTTYNCYEGGFVLVIGAPGVVARGTYGKDIGENIAPGSVILYGYYVLVDENNNGSIYHFRSNVPSRTNIEIPLSWNLDVYDYKSDLWGKSIGSIIINKRNLVLTSPKRDVSNRITYVPSKVEVNVPTGVTQTRTTTSVRQNNGLGITQIPISSRIQNNVTISKVTVPTYAPIIQQEVAINSNLINLVGDLISRNVITFYS
jgi:hypothetical protein